MVDVTNASQVQHAFQFVVCDRHGCGARMSLRSNTYVCCFFRFCLQQEEFGKVDVLVQAAGITGVLAVPLRLLAPPHFTPPAVLHVLPLES